jgi:hypothetical protein
MVPPMTTDAGLPAVRESLHLALLVDPAGSSTVVDLAQAEAADQPTDAAQRAVGVLDRIPAARLRSTARARLGRQLGTTEAAGVTDLHDRIRTLPPHIHSHGAASA